MPSFLSYFFNSKSESKSMINWNKTWLGGIHFSNGYSIDVLNVFH